MTDTSLALHFNAFTGKLEGGYFYSHRDPKNRDLHSPMMSAAACLRDMAQNPDRRCKPMKV